MLKKFSIALMTVCAAYCQGQIIQVDEMEQVFHHFKEADADTLALFDVDMVLLQPSDPAFQMANIKRFSPIAKRVMHAIPPEQLMLFFGLMSIQSEPILIDPSVPHQLLKLQQSGAGVMALTANLTGPLGSISSMEEWRIGTLKQLGINFSKNAPSKELFVFHDLPPYRGSYSTYAEGVLFVNGSVNSKGTALLSFLQKIEYFPKKIIFVDDREENLKSVEEAIQSINRPVEYLGIHYTGALSYPSPSISEEEFEARWQQLADEAVSLDADRVYINVNP